MPAFAMGFNSQGIVPYNNRRYYCKSPGFYLVASKNYDFLSGDLSFHGGLNYTLEHDDDEGPDLYAGSILLFRFVKVTLDYRAGLDDNIDTQKKGYLNLSVGFVSRENSEVSLLLLDMLENKNKGWGRALRVGFVTSF